MHTRTYEDVRYYLAMADTGSYSPSSDLCVSGGTCEINANGWINKL